MKVWVVSEHEDYAFGTVVAVCATAESATAQAQERVTAMGISYVPYESELRGLVCEIPGGSIDVQAWEVEP